MYNSVLMEKTGYSVNFLLKCYTQVGINNCQLRNKLVIHYNNHGMMVWLTELK